MTIFTCITLGVTALLNAAGIASPKSDAGDRVILLVLSLAAILSLLHVAGLM